MNLLKKSFLSSAVALLICTYAHADDIVYSIESQSLKDAIESISKKANTPYIVKGALLEGKKSDAIKDVKGTKNALNKLLEKSGLEAVIEDGAIIIQESKDVSTLNAISISASQEEGTAEEGYWVKSITGIGLWSERSLQDTPYSISVISNDLIENTQAENMTQIFKMNPVTQESGQSTTGNGDITDVYIRGFSSKMPIINGIPYATNRALSPMIQNIERIEVINGATGFLYGGGRVGGAVNYITKKPTEYDLRDITIGNYGGDQYYIHTDLGGQFDEEGKFGYRINLLYQDGESTSNIHKEQKGASFVFDWQPTDNFYTDIKYTHRASKSLGENTFFYSLSDRSIFRSDKDYTPDWIIEELKADKIENSIKWNISDNITFRSGVMYEKIDSKSDTNYIYDEGNANSFMQFMFKGMWEKAENYGAYAYLDNKFDTFDVAHNLTVGYSANSYKYYATPGWLYQVVNGVSLNELKNTIWDGSASEEDTKYLNSGEEYKNILLGDDIRFNDQWSALIGANYATAITKSYYSEVGGSNNGQLKSKYDKSEVTPTLSLIYKPIKDLTTYVTYMESLEVGTIVAATYSNAGEILPPLLSKQYEIGAKYNLNDSILLSSALFRIEKVNQYENTMGSFLTLTQDGLQIHQGLEIMLMGKVTDNLTIMTGGTWMDLSVEESSDNSLEGKKPIDAASRMAKIYAEYNIPGLKGLAFTGGAYYTGQKYGDSANTDIIPAYTLLDAGLRYQTKIDKYPTIFRLNIANLTDKNYWASAYNLGDPRTIALSMKMQF